MPLISPDDRDYELLTTHDAHVKIGLALGPANESELQVFANRAGLLSLSNVLLWLVAKAWRRELLSFGALPFVEFDGSLSLFVRMTSEEPTGRDGLLARTDHGEQFEWAISEDDLQRVALGIHRLAGSPGHEYDRLRLEEGSVAGVHIRMTDAREWLKKGHA